MIRDQAIHYAEQYAAEEEAQHHKGDGRSSIHYPALFLFLGDKVAPAIGPVLARCERKWDNAGGVMALHAGAPSGSGSTQEKEGVTGRIGSGNSSIHERVMHMALPDSAGRDPRTVRRELYREFHEDSSYLAGMNRTLRHLSNSIADYGRLYSSFDVIHLSIVTRVDDPLNVLLPEVVLLARAILSQSFKSVQTDLYALINEREQGDNFGYSSSVGLAFLRELDGMQGADYTLNAPLLVTEEGLSILVAHGPAPLFDLVYLLSDKNERGLMSVHGMDDNYEIIAHISLLKNRVRLDADQASGHGGYNNMTFKSGIRGSTGRQGYASAGFSAVRRPNRQIALAVLYHALHYLAGRLQAGQPRSLKERQALFGLGADSLRARAEELLPEASGLAEMTGLMSHGRPSYSQLRMLSLREAEELLFGDGADAYFRSNFAEVAARRAAGVDPAREWAGMLAAGEQAAAPVTFYQLAEWTSGKAGDGGSVLEALRQHMGVLRSALLSAQEELERLYAESVERQPFQRVPLLDKRTVRNFIHYMFEAVYGRKYELLLLESELKLCLRYEAALEQLHADSKAKVAKMDALEEELQSVALTSIGRSKETMDQNIMEYYRTVTDEVMKDIENRRGAGIFFSERFLGSLSELLLQGSEAVAERLIELCRREVLTAAPFTLPFEEELLRRANVAAAYENRDIVSKEELFKQLYRRLEEEAAMNVRLFEYTQEHRHEEKYFFGDSSSEFLRYAFSADETTRIYRLGFVHEQRRSGVEKLNLMGGFHLEDLLYYRNGKVYYETYAGNGYQLHGLEEEQLPEMR